MRRIGLVLTGALAALILAQGPAQARCADDLAALQARVDRATKLHPEPPGAAAAAKVLNKFAQGDSQDEVDCYNAVARARRALAQAPPEAAQLGQAQQPLGVQPPPQALPQQPLQAQP